MKPHTFRVHHDDTFTDKPTRAAANGLAMILRGQGCKNVYVQPIGF